MQPSHHDQPSGYAPQSPSAPHQPSPPPAGAQQPSGEVKAPFWKRFLAVLIPVALVVTLRVLPGDLGVRITFGIAAGLVAGLLPYFVGRNRNRKLATAALLVSGAIGAYGGLLFAVPAAVVMTLVLWLAVKPANNGQAGVMPGQAGAPGQVGMPEQMGQVNAPGQYGQPAQQGQAPQSAPYGHPGQASPAPQQGPAGPSGPQPQPGQWPVR